MSNPTAPVRNGADSMSHTPTARVTRQASIRGTAWIVAALLVLSTVVRPASAQPAVPTRPPAPSQAPTPTATFPGGLPDAQTILGTLPSCAVRTGIAASTTVLQSGVPVTLTMDVQVECPRLLDRRSVVLVVGSVSPSRAADIALTFDVLVGVLEAADGTSLLTIDLARPGEASGWATTAQEFAGALGALRRIPVRPAFGPTSWSTGLDTADRTLRAVRPTSRPLLIVLDATGPAKAEAETVDRVAASLVATRDIVGQAWLLDASDIGWLAKRLAGRPEFSAMLVALLPMASDQATLATLVHQTLGAFGAPLDSVEIQLRLRPRWSAKIPLTQPSAEVSTPTLVNWVLPAGGYRAGGRFLAVVEADHSVGTGLAQALVFVPRAQPAPDTAASSTVLTFCDGLPLPSPPICAPTAVPSTGPPTLVPPPTPTPSLPPVIMLRLWLPYAQRGPR